MKMKKHVIYFILFLFVVSCANPEGKKAKVDKKKDVEKSTNTENFYIKKNKSVVNWEGTKPTGKHNGTVNFKNGELFTKEGKLTGGYFIVDMHTIKNEDLTDPAKNQKLVDHLKSPDFFSVDSFPIAKFEITDIIDSIGQTFVEGNMTIKNISHNITFPGTFRKTDSGYEAHAPAFTIDRSLWKVKYGSKSFFNNLKDSFIHDEITLSVNILAGETKAVIEQKANEN